jgi:hypothetical protein
MRPSALAFLILILVAPPALAQTALPGSVPYVGVWDCSVAWFTFTNETYNPGGSSVMQVTSVTVDGDDYALGFSNNYRLALLDVTDTTMTWHSPATGDDLACTRVYR